MDTGLQPEPELAAGGFSVCLQAMTGCGGQAVAGYAVQRPNDAEDTYQISMCEVWKTELVSVSRSGMPWPVSQSGQF